MEDTSYNQCAPLPFCKDYESNSANTTIRQIIKDIRNDLQNPEKSWAPEAVQKLQGDISFIEKEYDTVPQIIAAYEQFYPDLKESGAKYCTAEHQWSAIKEWVSSVSSANLPPEIKSAIENLRNSNYRDENDDDFENYCGGTSQSDHPTHPKCILDKAEKAFNSIKSCVDQKKANDESITKMYLKKKDFKKTIEEWLGDLKTLHDRANEFNTKKKYRSLYAVYLEASQTWKKIKRLASTSEPQDAAWFQKDLTEQLKKSLIAKHEVFCWHHDWLKKQDALAKAKVAYDSFTSNRRKDFLREAEDVAPAPQAPSKQGPQEAAAPTSTSATSITDVTTPEEI